MLHESHPFEAHAMHESHPFEAPLSDRTVDGATSRGLVTPLELGKRFLEDAHPQHDGRGALGKAWEAVLATRQTIIDQHHLPVICAHAPAHIHTHQIGLRTSEGGRGIHWRLGWQRRRRRLWHARAPRRVAAARV